MGYCPLEYVSLVAREHGLKGPDPTSLDEITTYSISRRKLGI